MEENAGYRMFVMLSIPLGAISIALLLSSGIGLLTVKPWGRKAAIGYALYAIAVGVVGMIANTMFLFLPLLEQAKTLQGAQAAGAIGGVIGGAVSGMLAFVYPVVLLIFMRRKVMVDAFSPARQVPSSLAEDQ